MIERALKPLRGSRGGITITVSPAARGRVRRMARASLVVAGYLAACTAVSLSLAAVLTSRLVWWVLGCVAVAGFALFRCRRAEKRS